MSTRLSDYDYQLPPGLIATRPLARRQDARMMVLDRATETIEHGVRGVCRNSLGQTTSWS